MNYIKIWQTSILLLAISTVSLAQNFQIKSNVEVESGYEVDWTKVSKFRKSADCYPFGKGDDNTSLGHESITVSVRQAGLDVSSTPVVSQAQQYQIGNISSGIRRIEDNHYEFFIQDSSNWSAYFHRGDSNCVIREHHWKVSSNKVTGKVVISFRMPENTWVAKLKFSGNTNGQAKIAKSISGDFHQAMIENNEVIFWASPGQELSVPVTLDLNNGNEAVVKFQVLAETFTQGSVPTYKRWLDLKSALASGEVDKSIFARDLLSLGSDLLKDKDGSIRLVNSIGTNDYKTLVDWLFGLANSTSSEFGKYERHVKAMSAAVGYYLAISLLDDLKKFCVNIDVYMPLSDRTVKTNGLVAANYWINRDVRRISAIQFPEIRAYLNELVRWENSGLSHSDVAKNPAEFKKLRDGYIKIRRYSQLAFDVYGDVKIGLNKSISIFGSYGTSQLVSQELETILTDLSKARSALNMQFEKEVMSFNLKNNEKIQASQVLAALDDLESKSKILSEKLLSKIKFVNLDPSQNSNSVLELMTSLLAHQVAIFDKPLKSSFAESIRKAFAQTDRARALNQNFRECLGMQ